jgi:hypothetical protein
MNEKNLADTGTKMRQAAEDTARATNTLVITLMPDELPKTLAALADARVNAEQTKIDLAAAKASFERSNATLILLAKHNSTKVEELDSKARALALAAYAESKDKNPAPGISIGVSSKTILVYDSKIALAWARETGIALALDTKALEKVTEATDLDFVTKTEVETQRVAIASDLTKFYNLAQTEAIDEPLA